MKYHFECPECGWDDVDAGSLVDYNPKTYCTICHWTGKKTQLEVWSKIIGLSRSEAKEITMKKRAQDVLDDVLYVSAFLSSLGDLYHNHRSAEEAMKSFTRLMHVSSEDLYKIMEKHKDGSSK